MSKPREVLIVGGGFTGLTAAYALSGRPGFSVRVVESGDQPGGLAGGFPLLGTSLEKTYHHIFLTDTDIRALVEELGLKDTLLWRDSSVGIYRGGKMYPFMSPVDLLRFTPCSLVGRVRLGMVALYLKHRRDWRGLAGETAHAWMTRACGASAMDSIWTPLLKGKFDRYFDKVSMAWLWARIHIRANSRPPGAGKEQLGYFRGGFAVIVRRLTEELARRKVPVETGMAVERFTRDRAAVINGKTVPFDDCIFTGPSPALAKLLPEGMPEDFVRRLRSIEYLGAICLVFVSDQDIGDYYWLNINEPGAPFLVFLNHTRLMDKADYQGRHVYYIGSYRPVDSPFFAMSDDELARVWWDYLRKMFPEFDPARVTERHVFRFKAAQHIVDTQYEQKIPPYQTPLPGLWLSNFSQIFPEDRGTNFAVREGLKIAGVVAADAEKSAAGQS
jgi:protoporphyrinogen oxidase